MNAYECYFTSVGEDILSDAEIVVRIEGIHNMSKYFVSGPFQYGHALQPRGKAVALAIDHGRTAFKRLNGAVQDHIFNAFNIYFDECTILQIKRVDCDGFHASMAMRDIFISCRRARRVG